VSSCQINQSVSILKEKLFSETDEVEMEDKKISKSLDIKKKEAKESLIVEKLEQDNKEIQKDQLSFELKDEKIKKEETLDKKKSKETIVIPIKEMGQTRETESKIVSFFTKFFVDDVDDSGDKKSSNSSTIKKIETKADKKKETSLSQLNKDSSENINNTESVDSDSFTNAQISKDSDSSAEGIEDESYNTGNSDDDEAYESEKKSSGYAFLNLKKPELKEKRIEKDNLVGLLLPLTGEKSAAGNLVINSLRYSMLLRPNQLNFKIFDTKGTPRGAVSAAEQGITNNVKTFIGPIFSDETREVKEHFKNKKRLTFFSLSPDLNNVSNNIIVSGQNPNDQISCITKHIAKNGSKNVLLIHHSDKYGYVIRNSFLKYVNDFGMMGVNIDFFEVDGNTDLNDNIKKISRFNERKLQLENEITKIKNNRDLDEEFKKSEIKSLERMLTLGSPFDSIIIASEGDRLLEILSHLAFYDINSENSNIYGTSLWEDTNKKDNLFKGTYYASSLKYKDDEFIQSFKNVFSKDPMSFNYHMHDLLDLVESYKIMSEKDKTNTVFNGEFTKSKIKSGFLQREIYLKRIKKNKNTEEVFNCRLNVI
tara:strand:- start:8 stop:1789 length:1782 start_codon:yes stop_codon:yes gene_type:complete